MQLRFGLPLLVFALIAAACSSESSSMSVTPNTRPLEASATAARPTETPMPALTATPEPPLPTETPEPPAVVAPTSTPMPSAPLVAQQAPPPAATAVPAPPPTAVPQPLAPPPPVTFNVTASSLKYSTSQLSARRGASVTVNFRNEDAGVTHDLSFSIAGLGHGHTCPGPCTDSYTFTAPAAGTYDFFCTVHMEMVGKLVVAP